MGHTPCTHDVLTSAAGAVSYTNAFSTYDFLLSIGVKPWVELGYMPCWMSGPDNVPPDTYWPTVDYGICLGAPREMQLWTDLISDYVGTMINRYGVEEVESWVFVLWNEPAGVNAMPGQSGPNGAWSKDFTYFDMFFNTSAAIKKHSKKIKFGGLSNVASDVTPSQCS